MGFQKIKATFLLVLLIAILPAAPVLAHRMIIEEVSEGVVKVGYDDGRFSRRTEVVIYDQQGMEIVRGSLDDDGMFYFQANNALLVEADDGLGHRAELVLGECAPKELHRGLTVALVSTGFILIAVLFQFRVIKRNDSKEE